MTRWWVSEGDPHAGLDDERLAHLSRVIDDFETRWNDESPLDRPIADGIEPGDDPESRPILLADLCAIDLEHRVRNGQDVGVESYLERFPELADSPWAVLHLERAHRFGVGSSSPSDPTSHDPTDSSGSTARFEIRELFASGSHCRVFVAWDHELKREVALKRLIRRTNLENRDDELRLIHEAQVTARLEHPGILPVHASGRLPDGLPFFVTRLIRGRTLEQAIVELHDRDIWRKRIDPARDAAVRDLVRRFVLVCQTAAYAHERGFLHRDIKPRNILLDSFARTYLIDWGLARPCGGPPPAAAPKDSDNHDPGRPAASGSRGFETEPGSTVGTLIYASPEQVSGDETKLGPRTDVYGLGATLYHLLTGRPPFPPDGAFDAVANRVVSHDFPAPRTLARNLPADLDAICLMAMKLDPTDRYESAQALADDLLAWLEDEPIIARREPFISRAARWSRRHRVTAAAAVAVALGGLSLVLGTRIAATMRHRVTFSHVDRLERLTLPEIPALVSALKPDRTLALDQINAFLARTDPAATARRDLVEIARLGLKPDDPDRLRSAIQASLSLETDLVNAILAQPPTSMLDAAELRPLLKPAGNALKPGLLRVIRNVDQTQTPEIQNRAGEVLLDFAADDLDELTRSIPDLPNPSLIAAIERLKAWPRPRVLASLRAVDPAPAVGWADQPPHPSWIEPPEPAVRAIELGQGFVDPHFSMAHSMTLEAWRGATAALQPAGYRPSRVRPYRGRDGSIGVAALWIRDGAEFEVAENLSADSFVTSNQAQTKLGRSLVDLAGYFPDPSAEIRFLACWVAIEKPMSIAWRRHVEFPNQRGLDRWPDQCPEVGFDLALSLDQDGNPVGPSWPRPDWVPFTAQLAEAPDGSLRLTRTWGLIEGMDTDVLPSCEPAPAFEERLTHGLLIRDLASATPRGESGAPPEPWYAVSWFSPTSRTCEVRLAIAVPDHLEQARALAREGYRPSAIAVIDGPDGPRASSAWQRPADVAANLKITGTRPLKHAVALDRLGDPEPLRSLCRRSHDPTDRFAFADQARDLGFTTADLIARLDGEVDPGVQQALLLALSSFTPSDWVPDRRDPFLARLRSLRFETIDPGVRASAGSLIASLSGTASPPEPPTSSPPGPPRANPDRRWQVDRQGIELALVTSPTPFFMGESRYFQAEVDAYDARHLVLIPRDFAIETAEVTVRMFRDFLDDPDRATELPPRSMAIYPDQPDVPVTGMTLADIARYANWRSLRDRIPPDQWCFIDDGATIRLAEDYLHRTGYRLPTEAEWEYVARAGTTTLRPFGRPIDTANRIMDRAGWYQDNTIGRIQPVRRLWPNDLGLFDVLGNAREMCLTRPGGYCHGRCQFPEPDVEDPALLPLPPAVVTRGGSFLYTESGLLSSHRSSCDTRNVPNDVGFRLARTLPP